MSSTRGRMACLALKARSLPRQSAARSETSATCSNDSPTRRSRSLEANCRLMWPWMMVSMLLKSWAMPAANGPRPPFLGLPEEAFQGQPFGQVFRQQQQVRLAAQLDQLGEHQHLAPLAALWSRAASDDAHGLASLQPVEPRPPRAAESTRDSARTTYG